MVGESVLLLKGHSRNHVTCMTNFSSIVGQLDAWFSRRKTHLENVRLYANINQHSQVSFTLFSASYTLV